MTAAQRRAAEAKMARRDKLERRGGRGARASRRTRYPGFLESDDMEDEEHAVRDEEHVDAARLAGTFWRGLPYMAGDLPNWGIWTSMDVEEPQKTDLHRLACSSSQPIPAPRRS